MRILVTLSLVVLAYAAVGLRLPEHPDAGMTTVDYTEVEVWWALLLLPVAVLALGLAVYGIAGLWRLRGQEGVATKRLAFCMAIVPSLVLACWPFRVALGFAREVWI